METKNIKKIYELLNKIPVTKENEKTIEEIKDCLLNGDFITALEKLKDVQIENVQENEEEIFINKIVNDTRYFVRTNQLKEDSLNL